MEKSWKDNNMLMDPVRTEAEEQKLLGEHLTAVGEYIYNMIPESIRDFIKSPGFFPSNGLASNLEIFNGETNFFGKNRKFNLYVCIDPEKRAINHRECRLSVFIEGYPRDEYFIGKSVGGNRPSFNTDLVDIGYDILENWPEIKKNAEAAIADFCDKISQKHNKRSSRNSLLDSFTL